MGISRKKAQEYADRIMERPRSAIELVLRRHKGGVTLLYHGRAVTRCYASRVGRLQALEMAVALGVGLPPVGNTVHVTIPNGVFYRAIGISSLDLRIPEARILLERLQEEAAMARGLGEAIES